MCPLWIYISWLNECVSLPQPVSSFANIDIKWGKDGPRFIYQHVDCMSSQVRLQMGMLEKMKVPWNVYFLSSYSGFLLDR